MLYILSDGPHTVSELAQELGLSQPAASRHLKVLRQRGMVIATRCGFNVQYSLGDARLIEALDLLRAALRDHLTHRAHLIQASSENLFQEHV
jgi:ArsR family transcriptional regulator